MAYVTIEGQPVSLWGERFVKLTDEVFGGEAPQYRIRSARQGFGRDAAQKQLYQALLRKYHASPTRFQAEWVALDVTGEEAVLATSELIYDCCSFTGAARVCTLTHDELSPVIWHLIGDGHHFPMGPVFALEWDSSPRASVSRILGTTNAHKVTLHIAPPLVTRIGGSLARLTVDYAGWRLTLGDGVEIAPGQLVPSESYM